VKKSENYTFGSFCLSLTIYLALSLLVLTVIAPMAFEAVHKQMAKNETEATEHQAAIAERERVAANSIGNCLRSK